MRVFPQFDGKKDTLITSIFSADIENQVEIKNQIEKSETGFSNAYIKPKFLITSAIITAGLLATDDQTYRDIHDFKLRNKIVGDISPVVTELGDGKFSLALFGGFFLHYCLFDDQKSLYTSKIGIESFLVSGIAVQFFKQIFGRERPSHATKEGGKFHGPFSFFSKKSNDIASFDAFPSGHTATAFSWASTLAELYPDGAMPYISYGMATVIAFSRITERTHWLSDCFVGAIMGIVSTKFVIYLNRNNSYGTVHPVLNNDFIGAQYSLNF
jgi:membrane-associated phospholipid phosphatase